MTNRELFERLKPYLIAQDPLYDGSQVLRYDVNKSFKLTLKGAQGFLEKDIVFITEHPGKILISVDRGVWEYPLEADFEHELVVSKLFYYETIGGPDDSN